MTVLRKILFREIKKIFCLVYVLVHLCNVQFSKADRLPTFDALSASKQVEKRETAAFTLSLSLSLCEQKTSVRHRFWMNQSNKKRKRRKRETATTENRLHTLQNQWKQFTLKKKSLLFIYLCGYYTLHCMWRVLIETLAIGSLQLNISPIIQKKGADACIHFYIFLYI